MAAVNLNHQQFNQAMNEGKAILVDYWAPWCGYCRRIGPAYDKASNLGPVGNKAHMERILARIEAGVAEQEAILPLTADRVMFRVRYTTEFDNNGKPVKAYGSAVPV